MTSRQLTHQAVPAPATNTHSLIQRRPLAVNKPGDHFEREADRVADAVVSDGPTPFTLSAVPITHVQREDAPKDKTDEEKYQEAAGKVGEAFLETPLGKELVEKVKQDRLVKGATEAGKSFIGTLPGKIITGAAAAGAVATLAATHKELPAQIPEIPLDVLTPGLSIEITYKGPVDKPTEAMITFKFTEQAPKGSGDKKPAMTDSEKFRAETARIAANQAKFRAGMKYPPGSPEDLQQKTENAAAKSALAKYAPGPDLDAMVKKYPWLQAPQPKSGPQLELPKPTFGYKPPALLGDEFKLKLPGEKKKEDEPALQRKAVNDATVSAAPPVVHETLASSGQPLDASTRTFMEARFGHDFGQVRVHTDARAAESARAVSALAYTVGRDMVFGSGQFQSQSSAGRRLIAHELTHVVQQRPEHVIHRKSPVVSTQPANPLPFTPTRSFKEIWPEFERARGSFDRDKAAKLAKQLTVAPHDFDDLLNHGIDIVSWLERNGEAEAASRLLGVVRSVWMIRFVSKSSLLPMRDTMGWIENNPGMLIALGRDAARSGKHEQAVLSLGVANEILSYYALQVSQKRMTEIEDENAKDAQTFEANKSDPAKLKALQGVDAFPRHIARTRQYDDLKSIYDRMREIYNVYPVLEREALAAGDAKGAAVARSKGTELQMEIRDKYTWGSAQKPGSISQEVLEPVETAEVSAVDTPKGPGLRLHGANNVETDLTQLPGLPSPKEIGNNVQVQNLGALQNALMAQTDFQAEIGREPEIRKAFGNDPVDLNETKKRQKVWQIMYGSYKKAGTGALGSLMALVGRYLKAFTIHTTYNVRDWGKSYLDSGMPTDLAGRAEQDCGVYALTVAWDVYQTVRQADSKLDVSFDLTTMLEHVTLIITDKSTNEYYVVNNDEVSPSQKGDPLEQIAPKYGAIRGLPYTVGPAMTMGLGSTKDPKQKFHDDAWTRYLASVDWGLHLEIPPDVKKLEKSDPEAFAQKALAIQKVRYEKFYADQEAFDREIKKLDPLVDALAPIAGDQAKLAAALGPVVDTAGSLAVLFTQIGPSVGVDAGSAKSRALLLQKSQFLFTMEQGQSVHPLARVALAILHLKTLGGTPTAKQDAFAKFCVTVPMFKQRMDQYQKAGAMDPF